MKTRLIGSITAALFLVLIGGGAAHGKPKFPTPPKENESIEESISRISYDQARGRRMITANEKQIKKIVGDKAFAEYKAGICSNLDCAGQRATARARSLAKKNTSIMRVMSELAQEKETLSSMVSTMAKPLEANKTVQPGVANTNNPIAGATPAGTPGPNRYLPPDPPPAAPGAAPGAAPAAPGTVPAPAAQPGQAAPPSAPGS